MMMCFSCSVYIYLLSIYKIQKEKKREMKDLSETRRNKEKLEKFNRSSFKNLDESVRVVIYFTVLHIYMLRS